jgi:hypothetical protein
MLPVVGSWLKEGIELWFRHCKNAPSVEDIVRQMGAIQAHARGQQNVVEAILSALAGPPLEDERFREPLLELCDALENPESPPVAVRDRLERIASRFAGLEDFQKEAETLLAEHEKKIGRLDQRVAELEVAGARRTPFETFEEYFAAQLEPASVFHHVHDMVGRQEVMGGLARFLESDGLAVAVLPGDGGVGKSRILLELARRQERQPPAFYFLSPNATIARGDLQSLPEGAACLVVDDAHRFAGLEDLVRLAMSPQRPSIKLLLSCRPSGERYITQSLRVVATERMILLPRLQALDPKTDGVTLARQCLGPEFQGLAERLAKVAGGVPLVITVGGRLIQDRRLGPELLTQEQRFRSDVLDCLMRDLPESLPGGVSTMRLLEAVSAIEPIYPGHDYSVSLLAEFLGASQSAVVRGLGALETTYHVLVRRGRRVRIQPDVLADHILFGAAVQDNSPTGFVKEVYDHFGSAFLTNVLTNASELQWRATLVGTAVAVLDEVWSDIRGKLPSLPLSARREMLGSLYDAAILSPVGVWSVVEWILAHPSAPPETNPLLARFDTGTWSPTEGIPRLLARLAWHEDYAERCAGILWTLGRDDQRALNPHPEHPLRVLQDILGYEDGRSLRLQRLALQGLRKAVEREHSEGIHRDVTPTS